MVSGLRAKVADEVAEGLWKQYPADGIQLDGSQGPSADLGDTLGDTLGKAGGSGRQDAKL